MKNLDGPIGIPLANHLIGPLNVTEADWDLLGLNGGAIGEGRIADVDHVESASAMAALLHEAICFRPFRHNWADNMVLLTMVSHKGDIA